jgi:hypothetical protein
MRFFSLALLILFFALLNLNADAQACGSYEVSVSVQDESRKPVENAVVQLLPLTKDETKGKQFVREENELSKFSIRFIEGHSLREFHKLIVSADGYKTAETELKVFSCRNQSVTVRLPKKNSAAAPVWDFTNSIQVSTEDAEGKALSGVKVIIKKDEKIVQTEVLEYFGAGFKLPNGEYLFRFEKEGFQPQEIKVDLTKIADLSIKSQLKPSKSSNKTSILTGNVYDPMGALIVNAKVTAVNQKGEKFETHTNDEGVYTLNLPFNEYQPTFSYRIAKYDITVEFVGFEKFILKDFKIIGGYAEKMHLDFALDVLVISDPETLQ